MKLRGVNQVQTMSEIGLTFANALRSILRQDPDVIMIGEIRDNETARIAVRASITGHLVLSTIHTNNSLNTIERLADMDVERYLLGSALEGIVSQRLCKRLCPKCRSSRKATEYEQSVFRSALHMEVTDVYTPVGCNECFHGYTGRVALHEVLIINQNLRDAIVNNMKKEDLRRLIYDESDMISILQDGLFKVMEGLTSFEEVLRVIDVDDDLGESDSDIKNAIIGKTDNNQLENVEEQENDDELVTLNQEEKEVESISFEDEVTDDLKVYQETLEDDRNLSKKDAESLDILKDDSLELLDEEDILEEIEQTEIQENPLETLEDSSVVDTLNL